ncbi:MAG TPA: hypothetical protein VGI41_03065 [Candidatus Udaeobacter sp.]|jgi:hypothetical protein
MSKLVAALLLFVVPALAWAEEQGTAYEALRVVGTQFGRGALNHVVSITGVEGNPQPEKWKIMLEDPSVPNRVREVEVADGRVASERTPSRSIAGSTEGATINTARLNLDSSGAYAVASHTAGNSHTRFSTASYTLRTDESGEPLWIVTLTNKSSRPVGTIYIGASRGTVRRTEGMFAGASMEEVETDRDESEGGIISAAEARIKGAFHRAQDEARDMFERVRHSFTDFINRD